MALGTIALVLLAALSHALWNRGVHSSSDRLATMAVSGLVGALILAPAALWRPPVAVWPLILLSGVVEAIYAGLLAAAYTRGSLDIAYPIGRGTAPLLVTLGGWAVLGQRPGPMAAAGALALGAGLVLVGLAGHRAGQGGAMVFAVLTGVSIATYSVIDARAVRMAWPPAYLGPALGVQGLVLVAAMAWGSRAPGSGDLRQRLTSALRPGALVGLGVVVAYGLVLMAFQGADAGRVSTLREVSVLLAVALAGKVTSRSTWAGAGLVVLGALAAAW